MKKTTKESTELVKVEALEAEVCFEIIELEDALLGMVTGGRPNGVCPIINFTSCPTNQCDPR